VDLTKLLQLAKNGDEAARANIIQAAYLDLRRVADAQMRNQRKDHTLSSTALVHEMAIRLLGCEQFTPENRTQFLAYAATAMRRILVDHARKNHAQKRNANRQRLEFDEALVAASEQSEDFIRLNEALNALTAVDPRMGRIVEMRYFGGMSYAEVATALGISMSTVSRDWEAAKIWLLCEMIEGNST
jgi:RNA polymerase sigma factor (TIGR02999 family)